MIILLNLLSSPIQCKCLKRFLQLTKNIFLVFLSSATSLITTTDIQIALLMARVTIAHRNHCGVASAWCLALRPRHALTSEDKQST